MSLNQDTLLNSYKLRYQNKGRNIDGGQDFTRSPMRYIHMTVGLYIM